MAKHRYKNKYRIKSNRLQNWDYGWSAYYFVTICTKNRVKYFGEIVNAKETVVLSSIGEIACRYWKEIPKHFPLVKLGEFVIMPNHIHGILVLDRGECVLAEKPNDNVPVETRHALSLQKRSHSQPQSIGSKRFQNQGKGTLSTIIGSYKSAVSKNAHQSGYCFTWQSRFYDHIIRTEESLLLIQNYIKNNPIQWKYDKLYVE
jgi:REP element-mobilizing transposase RayT